MSAASWSAAVAAAVFAGLDLQIGRLAVIDLKLGAGRQVQSERQLDQRDRGVGVAGHADVDEHDELPGLGQHRLLLDRAFQWRVAACRCCSGRSSRAAGHWPVRRIRPVASPAPGRFAPSLPRLWISPRFVRRPVRARRSGQPQ